MVEYNINSIRQLYFKPNYNQLCNGDARKILYGVTKFGYKLPPSMEDKSVGVCVVWIPKGGTLEESKILLIKTKTKGRWTFPKGHPDIGEDDLNASIREVFEETGVKLDKDNFLLEEWHHQNYTFFTQMHRDRWQRFKKTNPNVNIARPHVVYHKTVRLGLAILSEDLPEVIPHPVETETAEFIPLLSAKSMRGIQRGVVDWVIKIMRNYTDK